MCSLRGSEVEGRESVCQAWRVTDSHTQLYQPATILATQDPRGTPLQPLYRGE